MARLSLPASASLLLAGALAPLTAHALDSVSLFGGTNDEQTHIVRLAVTRDFDRTWPGEHWNGGGYWEASIAQVHRDQSLGRNSDLVDVGFTPVFRLTRGGEGWPQPFLEAGIGAHLLSDQWLGRKNLGSDFHFGSHVGGGVRWEHMELLLRAQHLSNAGLGQPNPGVNFYMAGIAWRF